MLNSLHGKEEYSASQATGALLGFKAENHLHPATPLFANSVVSYAKTKMSMQALGSDTTSQSSFGSSGYGSDAERDFQELLSKEFRPRHEQSDDEEPASTSFSHASQHSNAELQPPASNPGAQPPQSHVEPTVSNNMQAAVDSVTGQNGSIPLSFVNGKYVPVFQHLDFLHKPKGIGLEEMSLYEFVGCFHRVKSTDKDKERMQQAADASLDRPAATRGRTALTRFSFTADHPLHETHHLQLRANQALPIIVGRIPRFPTKRASGPITAAYKRDADRFAAWALTLFRPWNPDTNLPDELSWNSFCDWVSELQQQDTIVARTRLAFVTNAAHGLKTNHAVDAKLKAWRFREATQLADLPPKYQPAAYRNMTSAKGGEPPIFSKASREEAERVVNELVNMMAEQSTQDAQTNTMIRNTVDTVKRIFQHHDPPSSGFIFLS
jgi:hypothetical protein